VKSEKKPSTLSPIHSPTLKTLETNTKNTLSLLPHGNKHTLSVKVVVCFVVVVVVLCGGSGGA